MKKYFYFSRGQKIGIVIFLVIIFILLVINKSMPYLLKENTAYKSDLVVEINQFKNTLKDRPEQKYSFKKKNDSISKKTFVFNPNTLDSIGFVTLGIKPTIAHNILKYREKGGTFRKASDFLKIYGISEKQFSELLPYISIPVVEVPPTIKSNDFSKQEKKQICIIELNTCDTTQLKELKGIGSSFAKRIIKYRDILGGYANKEQLKEVYGLNAEKYDEIEKFVQIDTSFIKKIPVNKTSIERLKSHKYMNFYSAKAIYEQRKKLGKLTSKNDLKDLKDLPEETLQKILPYLSFE